MERDELARIIYPRSEAVRGRRFTQDTAIIPDVWVAYGTAEDLSKTRIELLLTPHANSDVRTLLSGLRHRLARERGIPPEEADRIFLAYNESHVLANLTYRELIRAVLPLSEWWKKQITDPAEPESLFLDRLTRRPDVVELLMEPGRQDPTSRYSEALLNFVRLAGAIALGRSMPEPVPERFYELREYVQEVVEKFQELVSQLPLEDLPEEPPLWSIFRNRPAEGAIAQSRLAVKADAAVRLFEISCKELAWAVIDSGIDASHPAFQRTPATGKGPSRVLRTYDFTRLRALLTSNIMDSGPEPSEFDNLPEEEQREIRRDLQRRLLTGRPLDWKLLGPLLEVPHDPEKYRRPENEHGTHVAGILAADWHPSTVLPAAPKPSARANTIPPRDLVGMCPDLELYDLRVFDKDGRGDEFTILAALQFVRFLNQSKDQMVIHGVNLSFSLPHAVDSFGCGSTPVCEECERLVGAGVVVVAAAGNRGYIDRGGVQFGDYRNISITDPGNADGVITVGATHRYMPHKYGVSYFSSRGPTGDGRLKPDLVAPGEKIESVIPQEGWATLDGTSMAAPHVSGAAALLMARHRELTGKPRRIKEILCRTATDLGRERSFQGAGMVDVLRALQSV